uniref:C2H2-type domain-containing protein n=1 Tax=Varanus komodoensis TaxID=61221 RepID=A0A8D2Q754_VARKO
QALVPIPVPSPGNPASAQPRKPHVCEECGKRFRILTNLERHQQRHAGPGSDGEVFRLPPPCGVSVGSVWGR